MIQWIRTSRLSIHNSLFWGGGLTELLLILDGVGEDGRQRILQVARLAALLEDARADGRQVLLHLWGSRRQTGKGFFRGTVRTRHFTEMCSGSETGSYLRLMDFCVTQLKAQGAALFEDARANGCQVLLDLWGSRRQTLLLRKQIVDPK